MISVTMTDKALLLKIITVRGTNVACLVNKIITIKKKLRQPTKATRKDRRKLIGSMNFSLDWDRPRTKATTKAMTKNSVIWTMMSL